MAGNDIGTDITGGVALPNGYDGVRIDSGASNNTIGGLAATPGTGAGNLISGNKNNGVEITDAGTDGNVVAGNLVGLNASGTQSLGNGACGIFVQTGAENNTIGGASAGDRNLTSGNGLAGIAFFELGASGNVAEGNWVGLNAAGTGTIGNNQTGIAIIDGATGDSALDNVVSGNGMAGVGIGPYVTTLGSSGNLVQGNLIGTGPAGTGELGNNGPGVLMEGPSFGNTIGGTANGVGNVISGNAGDGVEFSGSGVTGNLVEGNLIGTDLAGTLAIPNNGPGVVISNGANSNTVGGMAAGTRNIISGNAGGGIVFDGSDVTGTLIAGNYIGTNLTGTAAIANTGDGVRIIGTGLANNTIGGVTATPGTGAGNVISGNTGEGIEINGPGASGNVVAGNLIGTDVTGEAALPNGADGVILDGGASNNSIGGAAAGAGNVISGNLNLGIEVDWASDNVIAGNEIGTDAAGTAAIGNANNGILVSKWGADNTIGGTAAADANIIAGNGAAGISFNSNPAVAAGQNNTGAPQVSAASLRATISAQMPPAPRSPTWAMACNSSAAPPTTRSAAQPRAPAT